jgi:hypothetical protein
MQVERKRRGEKKKKMQRKKGEIFHKRKYKVNFGNR